MLAQVKANGNRVKQKHDDPSFWKLFFGSKPKKRLEESAKGISHLQYLQNVRSKDEVFCGDLNCRISKS